MKNTIEVQIYKPEVSAFADVDVSSAAIAHITKAIKKRGTGIGMRLSMEKSGCTGYSYSITYVDEAIATDHVYPIGDSLTVYIDAKYFPYLKGIKIDYIREGINQRFKFTNPNEKASCGCGESIGF
ncbi:iron-sulfur cluster assembly protein IscA [soil metagenome]